MSLDSMLIHTCTIENPSAGSTDVYNNETEGFAAPLTGVHCRLVEDRELVASNEVTEGYLKSVYKLMVRGDVNLLENARISNLTLEDGTVINDTFEVVDLFTRRGRKSHHKTATLERYS